MGGADDGSDGCPRDSGPDDGVAERVCQFVDRCGTHQTSAESDGHLYERHGNGVAIGTYTIKVKKSDNSLVTSGYTINVVAYSAGGGGYDPDDDAGQD